MYYAEGMKTMARMLGFGFQGQERENSRIKNEVVSLSSPYDSLSKKESYFVPYQRSYYIVTLTH